MTRIGRDVPLPPERGRFTKVRTEQLRLDTDPVGPRERWCQDAARRLRPVPLALGVLAMVGVAITVSTVFSAGGAAGFVWWMQHHTFDGAPPIDLGRPWVWRGVALTLGSMALAPAVHAAANHLERLVQRGGWDDHRALRELAPDAGVLPPATEVWDALVRRQVAGQGARPETVIRWLRSVREPPTEAARAHLLALREHFKDGEALAQTTITADPRGGIAHVVFGGVPYEAAELTTLTRRAAEGVRDLLATLPPA
ncbi:MAG: hypothetical protein H6735_11815 [Alphaproteobacteria bacterium]|nr:hypothetical protein [Alphaproteobacteria bacterium]